MHKRISFIAILLLFVMMQTACGADRTQNTDDASKDTLLELFPHPHDLPEELTKECDLDGDGESEIIRLQDLGYCGGDGGYAVLVTRTKDGMETEVPMPSNYNEESGFPYYVKWDGSQMEIGIGEEELVVISKSAVKKNYQERELMDSYTEAEGKAEEGMCDAVSGFMIQGTKDGQPVLVLKSYLSGFAGHSDCIGYGITKMKLNQDDSWDVSYEFLVDE